ncbi:MAG TPA: carbon-nitrogen hydrolase family protein [Candidatus Dormibacteraeota bacterium]|nr:carbon-nitrogen hydrolase family protein [Candidatus Dormibacteraeota bacterium]
MRERFTIAAVQPDSVWGEKEWRNLQTAVDAVEEAASRGADLITFPEGFPGPCNGPLDSAGRLSQPPIATLCELARRHRVHIVASDLEANPEIPDTYFLTLKLIDRSGEILANYRRVQPDNQYLNEYLHTRRHVLPGDRLVVVETDLARIGLLICSELWVPELPRSLTLMGAEVIVAPVNGRHSETRFGPRLWEQWRCLARTRAAENLNYVVVTQNIHVPGASGIGIIAGPDGPVATLDGAGIVYGEIDMVRLAWLRTHYYEPVLFEPPESADEPEFSCRPGQIHERRPELYGKLVEPQADAFDYFYFRRGLETWREEFERVHGFEPDRYAPYADRPVWRPRQTA